MPSGNPPHKQNREGRASDQQRVEMVRKSIADNSHFRLSTEEMHPDGYTYTYETLERLHKKYPDQTYYFIIGADSLYDFDTWCRPDRICKAASLLVATRNAVPEESLKEQMLYLEESKSFFRIQVGISKHLLNLWSFYHISMTIVEFFYGIWQIFRNKNVFREEFLLENNLFFLNGIQKRFYMV